MASYTDAEKIRAYLGVPSFTFEQATVATRIAAGVTTWIDHRTGRTWQTVTGTVADEVQPISGGAVYLTYHPVSAVTMVETRRRGGSDPWVVLDPSQYTLADPSAGRLEIPNGANNEDARVDYTNLITAPPDDVLLAATVLSAHYLMTALHPESAGLSSLSVGQNDISVHYAAGGESSQTVDVVMALRAIDAYRRVVLA